ncbi:MAG TPA: hypothetical protein VF790_14520 [Dissulfurispiraceae bacterium]
MLLREVAQNHWVFFGFFGGLILVMIFVLSYTAMWKTRRAEEEQAQVPITGLKSFYLWLQAAIPWILILTIAGTFIFAVAFTVMRAANPPNW